MSTLASGLAGNLAGSLMMVALAYNMDVFAAVVPMVIATAKAKMVLAPSVAFFKGIGANWLVNLAYYQAALSPTAPGKIAALWLPIATFITLGLEHSVANMFILPMGSVLGGGFGAIEIAQ